MRVTYIVHYFPPLNSTGARRVLAMAKYLTQMGDEVTVLTTPKRSSDGDLTEMVPDYCRTITLGKIKATVLDGHAVPQKSSRTGMTYRLILARRSATRLFGQLIDQRLIFAMRFVLGKVPAEVSQVLSKTDVIISSCPPWPVHLAALAAAQKYEKPWVADYRDQFSGNHFVPGNFLSRIVEARLEHFMLKKASAVVTVSPPMSAYYEEFHDTVTCIENGYDADQFDTTSDLPNDSGSLIVRHVGSTTRDRIPHGLFRALQDLPKDVLNRITVEFVGEHREMKDIVSSHYRDVANRLIFRPSVTHSEAVELIRTADILFIKETSAADSLSAQGVLTTKVFEYLAARRPIIAEVDDSTILGETVVQSGLALACSQSPKVIGRALTQYISKGYLTTPNNAFIEGFSRQKQASRLRLILQASTRQPD